MPEVDILVLGVGVVVADGQVDGGNAEVGGKDGDVRETAPRCLKSLGGDVVF